MEWALVQLEPRLAAWLLVELQPEPEPDTPGSARDAHDILVPDDQLVLDDPAVLARTISVDTMKVRATDFDIDSATQDHLYENGRKAATEFLAAAPRETGSSGTKTAEPPPRA